MALDLTTLTKVDASSRLSLSSTTLTYTAVPYNEATYAYIDYGAGYFTGTGFFEGQFNISSSGLSNGSSLIMGFGSAASSFSADTNSLGMILQANGASVFTVYADILQGGTETAVPGTATLNANTTYYYRIGFYAGMGRYGSNYIQIFSDSGRTTLVSKAINPRTASQAYRYFYPFRSVGNSLASTITGTHSNITVTAPAAGLDQTTLTKVDPNSRAAVYSDVSVVTTLGTNESAYVYKDYGTGYANSNFTIRALLNVSAFSAGSGQMASLLSFVNTLGHANTTADHQGISLVWASSTTFTLNAREVSGSTEYLSSASSTLSTNTPYWIQISRDKSVGTYGTLYVKVFSDPGYTTQVGSTVSVALHAKVSWRYLNAFQSYNASSSNFTTFTLGTISDSVSSSLSLDINFTQADNVVAATGVSKTAVSVSFTQDSNIVAATGTKNSPILQVAITQDSNTVSVTSLLKNTAQVTVVQADNTVSAHAALPSMMAITVAQESNIVSVAAGVKIIVEPYTVKVRHKLTGAPVVGLTTLTLTAEQPSTGFRLDFSDGTFKASPTQPTQTLSEVDATNQPGLYRHNLVTTLFSGWVNFEATYNDGTYIYAYGGESYYENGQRANGVWNSSQQSQINSIYSAIATSGTQIGETLKAVLAVALPWETIIESGLTAAQVLRIVAAALAGRVSGAGTTAEVFKGLDGVTNRIVSTVDPVGNRSSVVVDGT